ncbi:hypothetical protein PR048_017557 [Dryococelus australis]|uniref:Uncharacterized protein n=1 Tax=Dryococelus australis TaxID=614101 RepID=A0ABQ9H9Y4_9NEOP|nr:hypothetical protein PR048_017557 [Dryococelus australis]
MEQCRKARAGEKRDPRENPPTSGIVRRDSLLRMIEPSGRRAVIPLSHRGFYIASPVANSENDFPAKAGPGLTTIPPTINPRRCSGGRNPILGETAISRGYDSARLVSQMSVLGSAEMIQPGSPYREATRLSSRGHLTIWASKTTRYRQGGHKSRVVLVGAVESPSLAKHQRLATAIMAKVQEPCSVTGFFLCRHLRRHVREWRSEPSLRQAWVGHVDPLPGLQDLRPEPDGLLCVGILKRACLLPMMPQFGGTNKKTARRRSNHKKTIEWRFDTCKRMSSGDTAFVLNKRGFILKIANRDQFPVGSLPDSCKWESCRTMPLVGGFSRGFPPFPGLTFRRCSIHRLTLIGSQDFDSVEREDADEIKVLNPAAASSQCASIGCVILSGEEYKARSVCSQTDTDYRLSRTTGKSGIVMHCCKNYLAKSRRRRQPSLLPHVLLRIQRSWCNVFRRATMSTPSLHTKERNTTQLRQVDPVTEPPAVHNPTSMTRVLCIARLLNTKSTDVTGVVGRRQRRGTAGVGDKVSTLPRGRTGTGSELSCSAGCESTAARSRVEGGGGGGGRLPLSGGGSRLSKYKSRGGKEGGGDAKVAIGVMKGRMEEGEGVVAARDSTQEPGSNTGTKPRKRPGSERSSVSYVQPGRDEYPGSEPLRHFYWLSHNFPLAPLLWASLSREPHTSLCHTNAHFPLPALPPFSPVIRASEARCIHNAFCLATRRFVASVPLPKHTMIPHPTSLECPRALRALSSTVALLVGYHALTSFHTTHKHTLSSAVVSHPPPSPVFSADGILHQTSLDCRTLARWLPQILPILQGCGAGSGTKLLHMLRCAETNDYQKILVHPLKSSTPPAAS